MNKCNRCKFGKDAQINCKEFDGNDGDIYFLFDSVDNSDSIMKYFKALYQNSNIKYAAVSYALRCSKQTSPSYNEIDTCFIYTHREINKIDPKLVVTLGKKAFYAVTGLKSFEGHIGTLVYSNKIKRNVFPLYSLQSAFEENNTVENTIKQEKLIEWFKLIPTLIETKADKVKHYNFTIVDSYELFKQMYNNLYNKVVGLDIETEGLDPYDIPDEKNFSQGLKIKTIQIGTEDDIYVILPNIIFRYKDELEKLINNCKIVGQDFQFDARWILVRLGFFIKNWNFDTCLAEFLISGMKNNNLDYLTKKYNSDYYGYWLDVEKAGGAHKIRSQSKLYQYGADDIGTMFPIMKKQKKIMMRDGLLDYYNDIMMPNNRVLTKMALRGVEIDLDTLWKLDEKYDKKSKKLLMRASTLDGVLATEKHFKREFNPKSSLMLRWMLLDYYQLPVLKKTKPTNSAPEGNPSISSKEMGIYAEKYKNPYCLIMDKYRSIDTVRNHFLSGLVPKLIDGVAHTHYSLHATTTSRPNSTDPNLLNFPSKKEFKEVKKCIKARDGYTFVAADAAQVEVRIAAVYYKDDNLIALCNDDKKDDFHSVITAKVYNKSYEYISEGYQAGDVEISEMRRKCKTITFGILYQEGVESLAYALGISKEEAQDFIDDYFSSFPDLRDNIERQKLFVQKHGYVTTSFGFRRYFKYYSEEDKIENFGAFNKTLRDAVNTPIQGTAWQLIQIAMNNLDYDLEKNNEKSGLAMQIYDQIIVETLNKDINRIANMLKHVMTTANKPYPKLNKVMLKTDLESGSNLYTLTGMKTI